MYKRLVIVAVCYACVLLAYGDAGLPLGLAVPAIWVHWTEADTNMQVVAGFAGLGLASFLAASFLDRSSQSGRACAFVTVAMLVASTGAAIFSSEFPAVTLVSSVPLAGAVVWFAQAIRQD
jgi:hypothetical protein